ncbi:MAG: winged helix-turn-helix domain-containing protein [Alphaproteobacteria bacterium]|nr:winged helix-turn-helix domain-containing protein [Alphaproteobacteria bacterium]
MDDRLRLELGEVDLASGLLHGPHGERRLTERELRVLRRLVEAEGRVVTRQALLVEVLGHHPESLSRAPDDAIRCLRAKLERVPARPVHVLTAHGEGYRFAPLHETPALPAAEASEGLPLGGRRLDLAHQRVVWDDGRVEPLTAQEAALLRLLIDVVGAVVPRDQLHREVWGRRAVRDTRALDNAVRRLRTKLEVDPSNPRLLLTVRGRGLRFAVTPAVPDALPPPVPDALLIGRDEALAQARDALERAPLVTLTGPGGIGKTRLALELGRLHAAEGPVVFCALSSSRTREGLLVEIAAALGQPDAAGGRDPVQQLRHRLAAMAGGLLILDNLEQVLDPAREVLMAWTRGTGVRLLVTSREPLHLRAEQVVALGPLAPDDAQALFRSRARGLADDGEQDTIQALVDRLDRVPLAIELAAARSGLMGPRQLLERLDRRLSLLKQRDADAPQRHTSLRHAIAWSWDLLNPSEQRALAWCGVFVGSFSLRAWEALAPDGPDGALDVLEALRDKSLVTLAPGLPGEQRFRLLESIRAFAEEQLDQRGQREAATLRHAEWFVTEGEALAEAVATQGAAEPSRRLSLELENILHAFDRTLSERPVLAARLLLCVAAHLHQTGSVNAARVRLSRCLAALPPEQRRLRAWLLRERIRVGAHTPDGSSQAEAEAVLAEAQALGDVRLEIKARGLLGFIAEADGRIADVEAHCREMAAVSQRAGLAPDLGQATAYLGIVLRRQGRLDEAEDAYRRALAHLGTTGQCRFRAVTHTAYGVLELRRGRFESSLHHLSQAQGLAEHLYASGPRAAARLNLGYAMWLTGRAVQGEAVMRDALQEIHLFWPPHNVAVMVDALGRMLLLDGRTEEGAARLREALDALNPTADRDLCEAFLAAADRLLGHIDESRSRFDALRRRENDEVWAVLEVLDPQDAPDSAAPARGEPDALALHQARLLMAQAQRARTT